MILKTGDEGGISRLAGLRALQQQGVGGVDIPLATMSIGRVSTKQAMVGAHIRLKKRRDASDDDLRDPMTKNGGLEVKTSPYL